MGVKIHSQATRVYGDGYDLSCALSNVENRFMRDMASEPVFCEDATGKAVGKPSVAVPFTGYMFAGTDGADKMLHNAYNTGASMPITVHSMSAPGSLGFGFTGHLTELPRGFKASGAGSVTSGATWQGDFPFRGSVLASGVAVTGTGAVGTGWQWTETILNGSKCAVILHLIAHAGTPTNIVMKIEEGTNGTVWADVAGATALAFTAASPKSLHLRFTAAADLGPYFRLNVTTFTGFTSATLAGVVGKEVS